MDKRSTPRYRASCQFQLHQRRHDRRSGASYRPLFNAIAAALHVTAHAYIDPTTGSPFFVVRTTRRKSKGLLQAYGRNHALLSSLR